MCAESYAETVTYNVNGSLVPQRGYQTAVIGNHSVRWLAAAAASAASGGPPFFAYVAPHAPHLPSTPAPWYADAPFPPAAPRTHSWNAGWDG